MEFPEQLRYTKSHEWARRDDDGLTVGITEFAVDRLGDVTLVELPEPGSEVKAEQPFGTVESVKAVSDLYSPFDGKVVAINERLEDEPELVNDAPYGDGWMVRIAPSDAAAAERLLDVAAYRELVAKEEQE